jgi:hypothetical protein
MAANNPNTPQQEEPAAEPISTDELIKLFKESKAWYKGVFGKELLLAADRLQTLQADLNNRCDHCGANLTDHCFRCVAPQCCPKCCEIQSLQEALENTMKCNELQLSEEFTKQNVMMRENKQLTTEAARLREALEKIGQGYEYYEHLDDAAADAREALNLKEKE